MLAAFRALPFLWRVLTLVGLLSAAGGALWGVYAHIRAEGYREGYGKAQAECEAEQKAMELANNNAISAANKRLIEIADELSLQKLQVDDYVKAIDLATAQDPRGAALCLGPDSVRRLNAVH